MTTHKKRNSIVVFAIIGAIAMAGAAYAYWTAGGSGTGSATTEQQTRRSRPTRRASSTTSTRTVR